MKSSLQLFRISWIRLARLSAPVSAASRQVIQNATCLSNLSDIGSITLRSMDVLPVTVDVLTTRKLC